MESKPVLIAMMGLPRSGKSTICKQLSKKFGWPIVNRDALRLAVHGQRYAPEAEPLIKALDIYMIRALFGAGHEYVLADETNYSKEARNHLKDDKWTTVFYPVMTSPSVCAERAIKTDQPDLVPVINEMFHRYTELPDNEWRYHNTLKNGRLVFKLGTASEGFTATSLEHQNTIYSDFPTTTTAPTFE